MSQHADRPAVDVLDLSPAPTAARCDERPRDVSELVRQYRSNASILDENRELAAAIRVHQAEKDAATLAQVRAEMTRRRDALPEHRTPAAHGAVEVIAAVEKILDAANATPLDIMDACGAE